MAQHTAHIDIGTVQLFVRQIGAGRDLVVLHGGPDWSHDYLLDALLPLADICRITFYDHRGCGLSTRLGRVDAYSLDLAVDDLAALLEKLELNNPILLGFSWGGRVALRFLSRFPGKAAGLILASSTAYTDFQAELDTKPDYKERKARAKADFQSRLTGRETAAEVTKAMAYAHLPLGIWNPENLPAAKIVLSGIAWSGEWWEALQAGQLAGVTHPDYAAVLRENSLPTLILHGQHDLSFPVEVAERLRYEVPQARLAVVEGAHFCFIDAPETWRQSIRDFVQTLE